MSIPERARRKPGASSVEDMRNVTPEDQTIEIQNTRYRRTQALRGFSSTDLPAPNATQTLLAIDTTLYDTSQYHRNLVSHRLYVPIQGYYLVIANYQADVIKDNRCWTVHYVDDHGTDTVVAHELQHSPEGRWGQVSTVHRAEKGSYFYSAMLNNGGLFTMQSAFDYSPELSIALLGVDREDLPAADALVSYGG